METLQAWGIAADELLEEEAFLADDFLLGSFEIPAEEIGYDETEELEETSEEAEEI